MFSSQLQTTTKTENASTPLAEIIRQETDDGRILVRVLRDIAEGKIEDTKPHHRIAAVKELYRQRRENIPDHSCVCDNSENVAQPAGNTTSEEVEMPSDETPGSDQPTETPLAAESELDNSTENSDSVIPEPDQSHEVPVLADIDPHQTQESADFAVQELDQSPEEPNLAGPVTGKTLENPDFAESPRRRPHLTRRERRLRNARLLREGNSTIITSPLDNDPANNQSEVDGVVSAGFQ